MAKSLEFPGAQKHYWKVLEFYAGANFSYNFCKDDYFYSFGALTDYDSYGEEKKPTENIMSWSLFFFIRGNHISSQVL